MNRWIVLAVLAGCGGSQAPEPAPIAHRAPPAPAPAHDRDASASLPPPCASYRQELDKVEHCSKTPPATRDALEQSYTAFATSLVDFAALPPDTQAAIVAGCRAAEDAVHQAGDALCP